MKRNSLLLFAILAPLVFCCCQSNAPLLGFSKNYGNQQICLVLKTYDSSITGYFHAEIEYLPLHLAAEKARLIHENQKEGEKKASLIIGRRETILLSKNEYSWIKKGVVIRREFTKKELLDDGVWHYNFHRNFLLEID
jgi:hypothetical protein